MAHMGWATLRFLWHHFTRTPWLCDGLVLGATVVAISSSSALAFASALMRFPRTTSSSYYSHSSASVQKGMISSSSFYACPECNALRCFNNNFNRPTATGYSATLLEFSTDSLVTETVMSFTISFVIVTFALFLVREMK